MSADFNYSIYKLTKQNIHYLTVKEMEKLLASPEQTTKKGHRDFGLDSPQKQDAPLFQNSQKKELTRQGIAYILSKYTELCGFTEMSPHRIKHSMAMHLTEADANPFFIIDILDRSGSNPLPQTNQTTWTEDEGLMDWLTGLGK